MFAERYTNHNLQCTGRKCGKGGVRRSGVLTTVATSAAKCKRLAAAVGPRCSASLFLSPPSACRRQSHTPLQMERCLHTLTLLRPAQVGPTHKVLCGSPRMYAKTREFVKSMSQRMQCLNQTELGRPGKPTSGLVMAYLLLPYCGRVSLYGFGMPKIEGMQDVATYKYFNAGRGSVALAHNMDVETALLRALAFEGACIGLCKSMQVRTACLGDTLCR
eukprot:scaffold2552_cov380-Prasinococcus_capsulatus_cf.AAC.3